MFGMNDIGRDNYVPQPTEKQLQNPKNCMDWYQKNMRKLISRLKKEAKVPAIYYITPSPFDDEVVIPDRKNNQPGCNAALGRCAEFVKSEAAKDPAATVVDFYTNMNDINRKAQRPPPVHPDRQ